MVDAGVAAAAGVEVVAVAGAVLKDAALAVGTAVELSAVLAVGTAVELPAVEAADPLELGAK